MNILVVGAHHDDIELGCGGSIAKFVAEGNKVYGITLTNSETSFKYKEIYRSQSQAIIEANKAAKVIGIEMLDIDFPLSDNGMLVYNTDLMRKIESVVYKYKIELVFSHWRYDMNTDHAEAAKMTIVAARHVPTVLQYRSNWYQPDRAFNGIYFIDVSKHIDKKIKSLECYQVEINNRGREWIQSFVDYNRSWGFSVGVDYAELFEPIKVTHF
jgi:LmbE family N-acetylglucosaminyl deacetylase